MKQITTMLDNMVQELGKLRAEGDQVKIKIYLESLIPPVEMLIEALIVIHNSAVDLYKEVTAVEKKEPILITVPASERMQ
jgi:hypothetical protein